MCMRLLVIHSHKCTCSTAIPFVLVCGSHKLHVFLMEIGSVEQAKQAVDAGVDAIIVQGLEAGGHVLGKVSVHVVLLCNYKSLMASYLDQ